MRVADYIAKFLVRHGVRDIFVLTGHGAMYLNDAITLQPELKYYCARNEAAAPMMAEAYARVKKSLGAVCLTSGPGSTNAIPGLAEAWVDSAPVLIISGQVQRSHTTYAVGLPGLRTFGTAEINIVPVVRSITKYAEMVTEPESIRYHLEKAYYLATSGRPGPVWLDIPMDVQFAEVEEEKLEPFVPPAQAWAWADLDAGVEEVAKLLLSAKRPLLVGGHGVRLAGAVPEFRALSEKLKIPFILSRFAQDMLPYSHPCNMGQAGIKGVRFCAAVMKSADLVLSLGCRMAVQLAGHRFDAFAPDAKVVMVDIEKDELKKPGVPLHRAVHADVKPFLKKLLDRLSASHALPQEEKWLEDCQKLKLEHPMIKPEMKRNPIDLYYFMSRLDALSGPRHIFTTDAGSNYYVGGQVYHFEEGQREITSGTFAAMGLSIPLAIGSAIAAPDSQILGVTGDGSLELNIQELKTISYYQLNIKLFVINNGGYLSMRNWQDGFFEGRRIGSDDETGAESLDLKKVAEAFGLEYAQISRAEDIDSQLKKMMSERGPLFVEVLCDTRQKIIEPIKDFSVKIEKASSACP